MSFGFNRPSTSQPRIAPRDQIVEENKTHFIRVNERPSTAVHRSLTRNEADPSSLINISQLSSGLCPTSGS
jgi:hypothetical protein